MRLERIYFNDIEDDIHLLIVKLFGLDIGSGEIGLTISMAQLLNHLFFPTGILYYISNF